MFPNAMFWLGAPGRSGRLVLSIVAVAAVIISLVCSCSPGSSKAMPTSQASPRFVDVSTSTPYMGWNTYYGVGAGSTSARL